eukprot:835244-Amorphochlora_amoeboformis.AAC.2
MGCADVGSSSKTWNVSELAGQWQRIMSKRAKRRGSILMTPRSCGEKWVFLRNPRELTAIPGLIFIIGKFIQEKLPKVKL